MLVTTHPSIARPDYSCKVMQQRGEAIRVTVMNSAARRTEAMSKLTS